MGDCAKCFAEVKVDLACLLLLLGVAQEKNLLVLENTNQQSQGLFRRQKEVWRSSRVNDEHYWYKEKQQGETFSNSRHARINFHGQMDERSVAEQDS